MDVYERIVELCKEKGIATTALEKELGFSRGSIGKMKTAKRPNAERLQKIADYFDIPVSQLMGEKPIVRAGSRIMRVYHPNPIPEQKRMSIEEMLAGGDFYYLDKKTAEVAQKYFEHPEYHVLFDAAENAKAEDIELAAEFLTRMKKTNPDG